jgi:hypothetical protein
VSEHTATMEVLTAEVRVLQVGSRQIALSVYGQLDEVRADDIKPFGRVRSRNSSYALTEVVGSDDDGRLCRSWLHDDGLEIGWAEGPPGGRLISARKNPERAEAVRKYAAMWSALPLIVLAGLR